MGNNNKKVFPYYLRKFEPKEEPKKEGFLQRKYESWKQRRQEERQARQLYETRYREELRTERRTSAILSARREARRRAREEFRRPRKGSGIMGMLASGYKTIGREASGMPLVQGLWGVEPRRIKKKKTGRKFIIKGGKAYPVAGRGETKRKKKRYNPFDMSTW